MEVPLEDIHAIAKAMMKGKIVAVNFDDQHNGKFKMANCTVELGDGRFVWLDLDIHEFPHDYKVISIV